MMKIIMQNPVFRELSSLRSCSLPATSFAPQRDFSTTVEILVPSTSLNKNIYYYPYAIAGKTGFTTEAQNCLVSVSKKDNMELTCVILGAGKTPDGLSLKFLETINLCNYGFNNFKIDKLCNSDDVIDFVEIANATPETKRLPLKIKDSLSALTTQSESLSSIKPSITLDNNLKAPITENQVLGKATYTVNGLTYSSDIIAANSVEKSVVFDIIIKVCISLAIIFIVFIIFLLTKTVKKKHKSK